MSSRSHGPRRLGPGRRALWSQGLVIDLRALVEVLEEPQHLVGISLGGIIALVAAIKTTDAFGRLVVANSFASTANDDFRKLAAAWGAALHADDGLLRVLDEAWPQMLNDGFRASAEGRRTYQNWHGVAAAAEGASVANIVEGIAEVDLQDKLALVANDVLLIAGSDDPMSPPAVSRAMEQALPRARFVEIADTRHLSNVDSAKAFNAGLVPFLAGPS